MALTSNSYRILVLEGGRHSLPEHFQNLPLNGQPGSEVWGLAWRTNVAGGFPGLAYTVGGRSLFFGGWSPRQLDAQGALALPKRLLKVPLRSACFATPGQLSLEKPGTGNIRDRLSVIMKRNRMKIQSLAQWCPRRAHLHSTAFGEGSTSGIHQAKLIFRCVRDTC